MSCGDAAVATWRFRGDKSRRRRGRDVDSPWRAGDVVIHWQRPHQEIFVLRGRAALLEGVGRRVALDEGDWLALPAATTVSRFRAAEGATVLVKELWPYDDWRQRRRESEGAWISSRALGRAEGHGFVPAATRRLAPARSHSEL